MKRALLLFLAFTAAWLAGCDKQDDGPAPELTLSGGTEKTLATGGGSESVTFTTNTTWSAEIASATPGEWCRVSPESGGAGPATVTVTAEANPDTRSRTAVLTIRAGGLTETVTFTQGEKGTVSLAQKVYQDIPAEGLSFDILFDGSLDCDQYGAKVLIEYRNWLSVEQPEEGESSYRIGVTVRPNTSSSPRSGRIAIVDKTGAGLDTVTVEQLQQNVLKWDPRRIEHDYTADVISSELQSNTEYRIEIEQQEPAWVSRIESKAASTEDLRFRIGRNESKLPRTALVIVQSTNSDSPLRDTLTIVQSGIADFYRDKEVITVQQATEGNVDLVFMGDGFTIDDMATQNGYYETSLRKAVDYFFDVEPYRTYRNYFNVYIVCAVSNDRGISGSLDHKGETLDTKFSVAYTDVGNSSGMEVDAEPALEYAEAAPIRDVTQTLIVMIANCPDYGGTTWSWGDGSSIAICPMIENEPPSDYRGVVQHEAGGHGFGKLIDEYVYYSTELPDEMKAAFRQWEGFGHNANADLTDDRERIKWREFYELPQYGMVGAFEGAYLYARGIWRPETNSCMDNNVSYFNAPSRKKIVERIMELSGKPFDMNDFLAKDAINLSTSARSRLREPRAGELFVPFAPPVLTVGNSSAKSFCRLEHVAGEVPFFAIFYGLPAFCRADPLGAAGGDGRCAGVNSAGQAAVMNMRTFGQSVRIGTGGRSRAGCFVRRHEQVAQPHPSVQFLIERDGMGGAGRRQDQRTVFRDERAEVFPVQSCGALSVESDRADRGIAAQQFVYAVRLLVADVAVEASFPLALSADVPQRDARVEQHGFPQRVVFGQFPVAQPCHDRPECVARVTVILSFCERHRARHRAQHEHAAVLVGDRSETLQF